MIGKSNTTSGVPGGAGETETASNRHYPELDVAVTINLVSAGLYGWPKDDAIDVAATTITASASGVAHVRLVAFDEATAQQMRSRLER
ncbi:hypothetical protein [Agrococcus sp. Marseille-Q4369]|uniref:hypothetical protein n=1 Tax=Agrococcus sp. Marseille-Q4369 TaxID=2810513 RepID=UPI001B8CCE1F|nr:hypothetical protein [Agrococcus sp. Marseille-Q4369]QUW17834.1 hypothetical protein JSQ78_08120 [Agrococcus sp. Marseille-Q4369]